jgi:hypothetical protein
MFRNTMRRRDTSSDLLAGWVPKIAEVAPHWDSITFEACEDLVAAVVTGEWPIVEAGLTRFGRELGQNGWLLREVASWVDALALIAGPHRRRLSHFSAGVAVAQGWAEGSTQGSQSDSCIDPVTGLATLPVLHLRLAQTFDQAAAIGSCASELYCLVVIDTLMDELHPFERDAIRAVAAELVAETFTGGETMAHHDGRIMVLTSSHDNVRDRMLDLIVAFDASPLLDTCSPVCWIEQLPSSRAQLDRYLYELTPSTL